MILNVNFALKRNYTSWNWKRYMTQMDPKNCFYNTAISVQPPYIAGHSLKHVKIRYKFF